MWRRLTACSAGCRAQDTNQVTRLHQGNALAMPRARHTLDASPVWQIMNVLLESARRTFKATNLWDELQDGHIRVDNQLSDGIEHGLLD